MHVIKNKTQKIVIISVFLVFAFLITLVRYNQDPSLGKYQSFTTDENIKRADIDISYTLTGGAGIYIDDSDPSHDWSTNEATYDWIDGSGTLGDPYEILNVLFDGEGRDIHLIIIKNSYAYFRIEECILYNCNYNGIYLENVENGIISNVNTSYCSNGIRLVNSNYTRIQGIFARNNYNSGITVLGGSTNRIKNSSISNGRGIILGGGTFNNDVLENIITTGGLHDYGIFIDQSQYNNVTNNLFSDFQQKYGILLGSSDNNNISGNTVRNSGCGIIIQNSDYNVISANSILNGTDKGLYIATSLGNSISKNNISENKLQGIYITNSHNHFIWENTVMNNGVDDIYLFNTSAVNLALNEMNGSGLYFDIPYSSLADINIETSNLVNGKPILLYINQTGLGQADFINAGQIFLYDCNDTIISDLEFDFVTTGITLNRCINSTISSNEASNNYRWVVSLFSCNYNRILNNNAINSSFILENSNHSQLIGNTASNSMTNGISLENCHNNYIIGNTANYHDKTGIRLYNANHNQLIGNTANYNREIGIRLYNANHNQLIGNTASYSKTDGISLENCHNNYISGNTANYNREIGFRLYNTNHGLIHNNVANNNNETGISVRGQDRTYVYNGTDSIWLSTILINNTLISNEANDNVKIGIEIYRVEDIFITGNTAKRNEDGIVVEIFESGLISENEFIGNVFGLTLRSGSDMIVSNNTCNSNIEWWHYGFTNSKIGAGILIESCQRVEVTNNTTNENAEGLVISDSSACNVADNHISENGEWVVINIFFPSTPLGDAGIKISASTYINVKANILDDNGIGVSEGYNNSFIFNQINGFGFVIENSYDNIISGNLITGALIAIDLDTSSYNNITFNIIIAQQCFRERGNCTANLFEDNDCTEVLPEFYLREIVSIIGLASVLGLSIPLTLKKHKERKRSEI